MICRRPFLSTALLGTAALAAWTAEPASAQRNRGTEFRSLNSDKYQIEIQKDGLVDVYLAGGHPAVYDAFPMVWFSDKPRAERLSTDGRWTQRYRVEDRLGDGSGMLQKYKTLEWTLRTYPTRTYFAVQAGYTNTGKKPVTVRALMPWCVGDPGKGVILLGEGSGDSSVLTGAMNGRSELGRVPAEGPSAIAVWNPRTGRSMIAGFVTQGRATTRFEIGQTKPGEDTAFYSFRAVCEFDPPVTVEPGQQVLSEVLYLAFVELEPVTGLHRYARAVNIVNKVGEQPAPFRAWIVSRQAEGLGESLRRARELASVDDVPFVLFQDAEQARAVESAELSALAANTGASIAAGYRPALWCDPFVHRADGALVRARPDAFLDAPETSAYRTLDLGQESALGLVEAAGRELAAAGVRAVAGVDVDRLEAVRFSGHRTGTELISAGMQALRRGLGQDGRIYAAAPSLLAAIVADGTVPARPSAHDAVASTSVAPSGVSLDGHTNAAAWHVVAAASTMTDAALLLDLASVIERPDARERMELLFPATAGRAVQADLFLAEDPRVLHARHENAAGVAHQLAVFNWHAAAESTSIPLARLGDPRGTYYTVYDVWAGRYLGTATDRLDVVVAPGDASMLVLRPFVSRPMPLLIGTNLGQSSPTIEVCDYDPAGGLLRIETNGPRPYTLPLLLPENLIIDRMGSTSGTVSLRNSDENTRVVYLDVTPGPDSRAAFALQFRR
jgi:hypothetical protein